MLALPLTADLLKISMAKAEKAAKRMHNILKSRVHSRALTKTNANIHTLTMYYIFHLRITWSSFFAHSTILDLRCKVLSPYSKHTKNKLPMSKKKTF